MNFEAFEWVIRNIIENYKCKTCFSKSNKREIFIKWISWNVVSIEIICQKCWNKTSMQTEVISIDLTKHLNEKQLEDLKENFFKLNSEAISDKDIVNLDKDLKKENINVKDLFK